MFFLFPSLSRLSTSGNNPTTTKTKPIFPSIILSSFLIGAVADTTTTTTVATASTNTITIIKVTATFQTTRWYLLLLLSGILLVTIKEDCCHVEGFFPYRYHCPPSSLFRSKIEMSSSGRNGSDNTSDVITFSSQLQGSKSATTTTLIILNSPIVGSGSNSNSNSNNNNPCFDKLWTQSDRRVCADGGANRLYKYNSALIPDLIRGDLDSLDPNVKTYYERHGVKIERDPCQDTNDLDKAVQTCCTKEPSDDDDGNNTNTTTTTILIYGAFGGRFDQEMASIQALYKWGPTFSYKIYLYSDETCAFLLPGDHQKTHIRLPFYGDNDPTFTESSSSSSMGEGPTCGLIPLGTKCDECVTDGLKWDLDGTMSMEFGGLVSTSNRLMKQTVSIRASHPIVFTAELLPQQGR